jgi:hypothetical protein
MTCFPLSTTGRLNVPNPGTPVPLSSNPLARAQRIEVWVVPGLTSKIYIGTAGLNRVTLASCHRILWPNTSGGPSEGWVLTAMEGSDSLRVSDYFIDCDVPGEGVIGGYWTE